MNFTLTTVVLAAGLSRRMGAENKLLLPFGKATILETTLANITAADMGETLVVVGHESAEIRAVLSQNAPFFTQNIKILTNNHYEKGMTTSIQTGIAAAGQESRGYMICLSDMPFIGSSDYQFLRNTFFDILATDPQAIVQPTFEGKRGNPTILSRFYQKDILDLTFTEGCKPIVQANAAHVYLVEMPTDAVLRDIDFMEEYLKIL
jgi:molybdenum cofactor cytidylyltransferase